MRFCKDCGNVLNFFRNNDTDLCFSCISRKKVSEQPPASSNPGTGQHQDVKILSETVLSVEKGRIILRSKEGWELWSGPEGTPVELQTLLSRAERIYRIRLKRQKN